MTAPSFICRTGCINQHGFREVLVFSGNLVYRMLSTSKVFLIFNVLIPCVLALKRQTDMKFSGMLFFSLWMRLSFDMHYLVVLVFFKGVSKYNPLDAPMFSPISSFL